MRLASRPELVMPASPPYDLAVVYRICPVMSRSAPVIFGGDKLLLSKVALESFKASLGRLRVKLWVLLDNCPPEYSELFTSLWDASDLVLEHHPGIGNRGTLLRQFQILCEQEDAELIYLAEDDYLYLPTTFEEIVSLLRERPEVDFVTPYYHSDYLTLSVQHHQQHILQRAERSWKTVKTTTGTFATRRTLFRKTHWVFRTLLQKVLFAEQSDVGVWLALTKYDIFNPASWITWPFKSRFFAWSLFSAWWTCWRQILFGARYRLWVADPSLCTHLAEGLMPSSHDWNKELETRIASIKGRMAV
jgi:hypothetical protein